MSTVISTYNTEGVDEAVLEGAGSGGILSPGYLREAPLSSYLDEDERAVFVRSNTKRGVTRRHVDGDSERRFTPGEDYRAFALVTDARLLFVVGDNDEDGDWSVAIDLADIEIVEHSEGLLANELALTTRSDAVWQFGCRDDLADLAAYVDAASMAWLRVESHLEDARKLVVDAGEHREAREYDAALGRLTAATEETAAARREERAFAADGVAAVATRIERAEARVREAKIETLRGRAVHRIDRAEELWRDDAYEAAYGQFLGAHEDYVAVLETADLDFEGSASVRKKIARVERNLAALERAPVDRAEQAHDRAREAEEPMERANHLERVLERYRRALELDWGADEGRFAGDTADLRETVDAVATDLVETRRRVATRRVAAGDDHRTADRPDEARAAYRDARDVLDETVATARELVPDAVDTLVEHRDAVDRRLDSLEGDRQVVTNP
jgi:hypothetical protein